MLLKTHRDFRLLWLAQVISQLGDKVYALTLAWWVLELTVSPSYPQGDPSRVGYMLAVGALAATFLGPWLGTLADRYPRKRLMMIADFARAFLCLFFAYLAASGGGSMAILYAVVFLVSVFNLLFNPATHAILGCLVTDEEMHEALSIQQITRDMCNVLGAAAGGALVAAVGVKLGFSVNAASFALSGVLIWLIARPEKVSNKDEHKQSGGLAFLKEQSTILGMLLVFCAANLFLVPLFVLVPSLVKIVLKESAAVLGGLEASLAVGSILTTALLLRISFKRRWISLCSAVVLSGLALLAMGATSLLPALGLLMAVIGGSIATVNVQFICILQLLTPEHLKGRVFSLMETIATGSFPIAYFLAGVAADYLALHLVFYICGVGLTIVGLLMAFVPGIRNI